MPKGDYKMTICTDSYFPAYEELIGEKLNITEKKAILKMTFKQIEVIGIMIAKSKGRDWHKVIGGH